jgi:hypothetical protein
MQRFILFENADRWFKSKISLLAYDEEKEQNVKQVYFFGYKPMM